MKNTEFGAAQKIRCTVLQTRKLRRYPKFPRHPKGKRSERAGQRGLEFTKRTQWLENVSANYKTNPLLVGPRSWRRRIERRICDFAAPAGLSFRAASIVSTPSLDSIPPYQPQPFVQASFGPLPVSPPAGAELCIVTSRSHRKGLPVNLVAEDAERAASVVVRCDDQDSCAFFARQAFFHVVRFLPGREPLNRTNLDRGSLR